MERVVIDIVVDFSVKPRSSSEPATLFWSRLSIYEARKYFTPFQTTPFKNKCAVVKPYNLQAHDVTREETDANIEHPRDRS
jgi:type I restriction enzyme R subunit